MNDGDAPDISITMVFFCMRYFNVLSSGTQKLFTKKLFLSFIEMHSCVWYLQTCLKLEVFLIAQLLQLQKTLFDNKISHQIENYS